jgi:UBX domain-containing protein 6
MCWWTGPDILTREEWNKKIKEFLYEQLEEERGLTACLIIHTCNKNREKVYSKTWLIRNLRDQKKVFLNYEEPL